MRNREIKFLMSMRDTATEKFRQFRSTVQRGVASMQRAFGGLGGYIAGAFAIGAIRKFVEASNEQEAALAKVTAAIKSTGGAAGVTAAEVRDMAAGFQKVTRFGDEVVLRGQAMLLTFTNIGRDTFPRATETMLNMAEAMGSDVKDAAIQLGKALNDPVLGATALRRVGVNLTEQQMKQIRVLMNQNRLMEAQKIILDELDVEFGNLARTVGDTAAGRMAQMANALSDVGEKAGDLIKIFTLEFHAEIVWVINAIGDSILMLGESMRYASAVFRRNWWQMMDELQEGYNFARPYLEKLLTAITRTVVTLPEWVTDYSGKIAAAMVDVVRSLDQVNRIVAGEWRQAADETLPDPKKRAAEWVNTYGDAGKLAAQSFAQGWKGVAKPALPAMMPFLSDEFMWEVRAQAAVVREEFMDAINSFIAPAWETWINAMRIGIVNVATEVEVAFRKTFETVFSEANSLLEIFIENVLAQMARIAAMQASAAGLAGILSLIPGIGTFGGIFKALGGIFHDGGRVPRAHDGMFINAPPSKEFPIMVRGGETVRTERQEFALQSVITSLMRAVDRLVAVNQAELRVVGTVDISNGQVMLRRELPAAIEFQKRKSV